jgi:hypothetical protein
VSQDAGIGQNIDKILFRRLTEFLISAFHQLMKIKPIIDQLFKGLIFALLSSRINENKLNKRLSCLYSRELL